MRGLASLSDEDRESYDLFRQAHPDLSDEEAQRVFGEANGTPREVDTLKTAEPTKAELDEAYRLFRDANPAMSDEEVDEAWARSLRQGA